MILAWSPRVKGRPRTTYTKGNPRTYTPKETVAAERALREQWTDPPATGPIAVRITLMDQGVQVDIEQVDDPASKKLRGDIDNYMKLILDALNGVAWIDDKQITQLTVRKL